MTQTPTEATIRRVWASSRLRAQSCRQTEYGEIGVLRGPLDLDIEGDKLRLSSPTYDDGRFTAVVDNPLDPGEPTNRVALKIDRVIAEFCKRAAKDYVPRPVKELHWETSSHHDS